MVKKGKRGHVALAVDDSPDILDQIDAALDSLGHRCVRATTQQEAEARLESGGFCYVLLDLEIPVRQNVFARVQTGYNLLESIRSERAADELPVLVMTAHGSDHTHATKAFKKGATDFIKKPFSRDSEPIEDKIREALAKSCEARHRTCPNANGGQASGRRHRPERKAPKGRGRPPKQSEDAPAIRIVGFVKKRRYLVEVDEEPIYITLQSLETLCRLAAPVLAGQIPAWVETRDFDCDSSQVHTRIYRLKRDLRDAMDVDRLIVNDGHGQYRLSVPRGNLSYVESEMRKDHRGLAEILDGRAGEATS